MTREQRIEELKAEVPTIQHTWRWRVTTLAAVVLLGLGVTGLVLGVSNQRAQSAEVACQAAINTQFQQTIVSRNDPNTRDRLALDKLVTTLSESLDAATINAALASYRQTRTEDDALRAQSPLTVPSAARCDN